MNQDTLLICGNCNNPEAVSSMKYNRTGEFLICKTCYNKEHNKLDPKVETAIKEEIKELEILPQKKTTVRSFQHVGFERLAYQCTHCGYKFSRKKEIDFNGQCPYCGKFTSEMADPRVEEEAAVDTTPSVFCDVDSLLR